MQLCPGPGWCGMGLGAAAIPIKMPVAFNRLDSPVLGRRSIRVDQKELGAMMTERWHAATPPSALQHVPANAGSAWYSKKGSAHKHQNNGQRRYSTWTLGHHNLPSAQDPSHISVRTATTTMNN